MAGKDSITLLHPATAPDSGEIDGRRRPIESVYEEGFRKKLHILITLSDLDYDGGY